MPRLLIARFAGDPNGYALLLTDGVADDPAEALDVALGLVEWRDHSPRPSNWVRARAGEWTAIVDVVKAYKIEQVWLDP